MTKDVIVSVMGMQFDVEDDEALSVISPATYHLKNGKHYIIYDELVPETGEHLTNTLKVGPGRLDMIKRGVYQTHMVFEEGKRNMSFYDTPMGQLLVGIQTIHIDVEESEHCLLVKIEYSLDINESHVSDCEINIKVTDKSWTNLELNA